MNILKNDLDSLNRESWLTDQIIEAFFHTFKPQHNLFVLSYNMATQIIMNGQLRTVSRKVI